MESGGSRATLQRGSWRSSREKSQGPLISRRLRRLIVSGVALTLLGLLGYLVFQPFWHPNAQLVLLSGAGYKTDLEYHLSQTAPLDFVAEDFDALAPLGDVLYRKLGADSPIRLDDLDSPDELRTLSLQLEESADAGVDVLIMYVAAHGISDDARAFLEFDFDSAVAPEGRIELDELLSRLGSNPAQVKVLILDSGRSDYDPRRGLVVNEFPRLLSESVAATGDRSIWVLNSNSEFERALVSPAMERSVFGYFVGRALKGAADVDDDRDVDVGELHRYVTTQVAAWTQATAGNHVTQTPRLIWGGGADPLPADYPVVVPVAQLDEAVPASHADHHIGVIATVQQTSDAARTYTGIYIPTGTDLVSRSPLGRVLYSTPVVEATYLASAMQQEGSEKPKPQSPPAEQGPTDAAVPGAEPTATEGQPNAPPAEGGDDSATVGDAGADDAQSSAQGEEPAGAPSDGQPAQTPSTDTPDPETPQGGQAPAGAATPQPAAGPQPPQVAALLEEAWQLSSALTLQAGVRPLDYAPHLWRERQERLIAYERLFRSGTAVDRTLLQSRVEALVNEFQSLAEGKPYRQSGVSFSDLQPIQPGSEFQPLSLGLLEALAAVDVATIPADLKPVARGLDSLIASGSWQEFDKWKETLKPGHEQYVEIRLATQLAPLRFVSWQVIRLALQVRRDGERVAASTFECTPWIRRRMKQADRSRLAGERELFDRIGNVREQTATRWLIAAGDEYRQAASDLLLVESALRMRDDLLFRLPYYLRWHQNAAREADNGAPRYSDLSQLLDALAQQTALLEKPDAAVVPEIRRLNGTLESLQNKIESGASESSAASLATPPIAPGDALRAAALLNTPLPAPATRQELLMAVSAAEIQLALNFRPQKVPSQLRPQISDFTEQCRPSRRQADLELRLAALTAVNQAHQARLTDAHRQLSQAHERLDAEPTSQEAQSAIWNAYRIFGSELQDFYDALPTRIESVSRMYANLADRSDRDERLGVLKAASRALRLLPTRDTAAIGRQTPGRILAPAAHYDFLEWHMARFLDARQDANADEVAFLTGAARRYQQAAAQIPGQPAVGSGTSIGLSLSGTDVLTLTTESNGIVEVVLQNVSSSPQAVWLVLDYDPDVITVRPLFGRQVIPESRLRDLMAPTGGEPSREMYPLIPEPLLIPASLTAQPGATESFRFAVDAQTAAPYSPAFVFKAITANSYVRHETQIVVPSPESVVLGIDGTPGTFTQSPEQTVLHPFPNRETRYQLALSNASGVTDKNVGIEVFALQSDVAVTLPGAALPTNDANALLERLGSLDRLAFVEKVAVPDNGRAVRIPFPLPANPEPATPPATPEQPATAEGQDQPAPKAPEQPPANPIPYGLLLVVTDQDADRKTLRHIVVRPQHPRRYIRPRISYRRETERIDIDILPVDRALLPPEGVSIQGTILEPLSSDLDAQLEGELGEPEFESRLYAEVPAESGRVVTLTLQVDGYPRAFLYRVPCDQETFDIDELTGILDVRIVDPPEGSAFKTPVETVPVRLEVDAPPGSFQSDTAIVEIGIDRDRDREFQDERTVRLYPDRQVDVSLVRAAPGGVIVVDTKVGDFEVDVPTRGVRSGRVNLLARVKAAGQTAWSRPVETVLDGSGPGVSLIELKGPGYVVLGQPAEAGVRVTDRGLSGVEKVLVGFDIERTGKFGGPVPPVAAEALDNGEWNVKLDTAPLKPGSYALLAQATDRVGNESAYGRLRVQVLTPQQVQELIASKTNRVTGIVQYGNKPFGGVSVTLEAAPPAEGANPDAAAAPPPPKSSVAITDDAGRFTFSEVQPGPYTLIAESVIRNKLRTAEQKISVPPSPAPVVDIRIDLP